MFIIGRNSKFKVIEKSLAFKILKAIALGGAFLIAASNERFWFNFYTNFNKEIKKFKNYKEKRKIYDALRYLRQRKFVDITDTSQGVKVKITTSGHEVIEFYKSIKSIKIKKPTRWDRKFRMVIFDIPAKKQSSRNVFLQKLKEMGFYMIQKSIWVYPYDCMNEIATLRKLFEIEPYVKVIVADAIEGEYNIRKSFGFMK